MLTIDLTRTSTKDTFDQVVDEIQYATAVDGFTALEQSDINAAGSQYQVAACVVSLGPGGITGIISQLDATEGGGAGGILTVTAPVGTAVTVSKDDKSKSKITGASGVAVFKGLKSGTWTVSISDGEQTASKAVEITTDYSMAISFNAIPEFTYTGDFEIVSDDDQPITVSQDNWKIRFLTSGTLIFTSLNGAENGIDVFLVGGGGNGSSRVWNPDDGAFTVGAGAGGGYTKTLRGVSVAAGVEYQITIGAATGASSAFSGSAAGGENPSSPSRGWASGGSGGSGGAGTHGTGGTDGGNGTSGQFASGGTGQGTTTREFSESSGKLYASGGNSGSDADVNANTGDGGHGRSSGNSSTGTGGSGIAIIRNAREAA